MHASPDRERARLRSLLQAVRVVYPDERFASEYGDVLVKIQARASYGS